MKRKKLSIGEKSDIAFRRYKLTSEYKRVLECIKPHLYSENVIRRVWDEAFTAGITIVFHRNNNLSIKKKPDDYFKANK
jgi:hypothetical protein